MSVGGPLSSTQCTEDLAADLAITGQSGAFNSVDKKNNFTGTNHSVSMTKL